MESGQQPWWAPDSSYFGVALMLLAGALTYLLFDNYLQLSGPMTAFFAAANALIVGFVYNSFSGTFDRKKILWSHFVFFNLLSR